MQTTRRLLLSWFGAGLSPKAPGTAGSLAALPFAWIIVTTGGASGLFIASIVAFALGWAIIATTPGLEDDPGWIVIDEVAGQWLTLVLVPADLVLYAIGFLLFRLFDIFKPWPIKTIEKRTPGALGVMLDDMVAALCAGIILFGFHLALSS